MDELRLHIKLADFGSCIDLNVVENARPSSLTGTLAFMSPEVLYCTQCFISLNERTN